MNKPKISIVVPVFNAEKYLARCITSVLNQTYSNIELVLVNDGSTDRSLDICMKYADHDNRVKVINKENNGVSAARNSGLEVISGDFVGFIDSDDYVDASMYEILLAEMLKHDADIAECGYFTTDSNYEIKESFPLKNTLVEGSYKCSRYYVEKKNTVNFVWNKLYKKFIFEELRFPLLSYSEDYALNVQAFYKCTRKATVNQCYYYYVQNDESAVNQKFTKKKLDAIEAGKITYQFHKEKYSDLCSFIALYISRHAISLFNELNDSDDIDKKEYEKIILNEFKKYYRLIDNQALKNIKFSRKRIEFLLFRFSPNLYSLIRKLAKK